MTLQKVIFSTFEEFIWSHKVYFENNSTLDICGKDIIVFNLPNGIFKCIGDVLYVWKLAKNLLSINQFKEQGFKVEFETTKCWLKSFDSNKVIAKVIQERRLYKLIGIVQSLVAKCSTKFKKNDLLYQRFRHVFYKL